MLKVGYCMSRNHNLVRIRNITCVGSSKSPLNHRFLRERNDFLTYNQNGIPLMIPYRLSFNPFARTKPKTEMKIKEKLSMKGFVSFIVKGSIVLISGIGIGGLAAYVYLMIYRPAQKARSRRE